MQHRHKRPAVNRFLDVEAEVDEDEEEDEEEDEYGRGLFVIVSAAFRTEVSQTSLLPMLEARAKKMTWRGVRRSMHVSTLNAI